jgi:hypothetical protein
MMEDNAIFELMIHLMELGVVIGIAAVVGFTIARQRHAFRSQDQLATGIATHPGSDPR